jgi:hypothetical protein
VDVAADFWLGTHMPNWLGRTDVPLFVSRRRLAHLKNLPAARGPWALDSGAFSELALYGRWTVTPRQYVREVCLWLDRPGKLAWAACMDWMCEPPILAGVAIVEGLFGADWRGRYEAVAPKDRLRWLAGANGPDMPEDLRRERVRLHQRRTVENYLELTDLTRHDLPFVPVLQGWDYQDYCRHFDDYKAAGVDLTRLPLVGLGSVCRRQDTTLAESLIRDLSARGVRVHGFGFKLRGLARVADVIASADSMAWSYDARRGAPLPGCTHRNCANCLRRALGWQAKVGRVLTRPNQSALF